LLPRSDRASHGDKLNRLGHSRPIFRCKELAIYQSIRSNVRMHVKASEVTSARSPIADCIIAKLCHCQFPGNNVNKYRALITFGFVYRHSFENYITLIEEHFS